MTNSTFWVLIGWVNEHRHTHTHRLRYYTRLFTKYNPGLFLGNSEFILLQ